MEKYSQREYEWDERMVEVITHDEIIFKSGVRFFKVFMLMNSKQAERVLNDFQKIYVLYVFKFSLLSLYFCVALEKL